MPHCLASTWQYARRTANPVTQFSPYRARCRPVHCVCRYATLRHYDILLGMRSRLRSAWAALLDRVPACLPALAAATAVITAVNNPGTFREIWVGGIAIALLSKKKAFARALSCGLPNL